MKRKILLLLAFVFGTYVFAYDMVFVQGGKCHGGIV